MKKTLSVLLLSIPLTAFATTNFANYSKYIVPISGSKIQSTDSHTNYTVSYGIDNGNKIELHVSVSNLHMYKENADLRESNKKYAEGSKTVFSYSTDVYTDKFIKFTSKNAIHATEENLKKLYCAPDKFYPLSSQERLFNETRKENKKVIINYYSDSGETLMFGIGVSPESCNSE